MSLIGWLLLIGGVLAAAFFVAVIMNYPEDGSF